jgi:hypothetical protein
VDFYGNCKFYYDVSVSEYAERLGISDVVRIHDPVPHERCASIMAGADLLLLLAQKQPLQIPNKLYEYLGAGRPIFAFADQDGETAEVLALLGQQHELVTGEGPALVERALERALRAGPERAIAYSDAILHELSTDSQLDRLVTALEHGGARASAERTVAPSAQPAYDLAPVNDNGLER